MKPFILQVPDPSGRQEEVTFYVQEGPVAFAGSRHGALPENSCSLLFSMLSSLGFSFMTGCATGIDQSFRQTMTDPSFTNNSHVACAFKKRADNLSASGLNASIVSRQGIHPVPALRERTIWLVKNCVMLFFFPDDPYSGKWGKGSTLAFKTAIDNKKPVFTTTATPPAFSFEYLVIPSDFFGIIKGYWILPTTIIKKEYVA